MRKSWRKREIRREYERRGEQKKLRGNRDVANLCPSNAIHKPLAALALRPSITATRSSMAIVDVTANSSLFFFFYGVILPDMFLLRNDAPG